MDLKVTRKATHEDIMRKLDLLEMLIGQLMTKDPELIRSRAQLVKYAADNPVEDTYDKDADAEGAREILNEIRNVKKNGNR